jgi:hypothetical protein
MIGGRILVAWLVTLPLTFAAGAAMALCARQVGAGVVVVGAAAAVLAILAWGGGRRRSGGQG